MLDRLQADGLRLTSLAEYPATDEWLKRFADFYWELGEDAPGMSGRARPGLAHMKSLLTEPAGAMLAADGDRWVAMCCLQPQDWGYYNQMTGVRPEYRGRGIGLAMKLAAVAYAQGQGARLMRTHNDSTNAPMLAVNQKLGFQPQPGLVWLKQDLLS